MMIEEDIFLKRIKEAMGEDSIAEFSKKVGISEDDAAKILSGEEEVRSSIEVRIASAYEVSLDWLLGLTEDKKVRSGFLADELLESWQS
ncbi:MAG: helix-turn-helix domain-containing protein [Lachnospiraceae bacterium]|nr:helix-turn-helix domain-containing protein [Lachnospiraceae bacterium]